MLAAATPAVFVLSGRSRSLIIFAQFSLLVFAPLLATAFNGSDADASVKFRYAEHARYKRQFDVSTSPQIDLNITVPYIFSARLYPYGVANGDEIMTGELRTLRLQTPLYFLDKIYNTVYIRRDGAIGLSAADVKQSPAVLPLSTPLIAVYWLKTRGGHVYYRETTEQNILNVAQNEVNIQYRYGNDFQTRSVVVVTWEDVIAGKDTDSKAKSSVFQVALILGDNACFAHFVYNRLAPNTDAVAGFNGAPADNSGDESAIAPTLPSHYSLPGSGTSHAAKLLEKSNIGIPGEWLFRVDEENIHLCGAGFQGLECVDSCSPTQWYLDCARQCHCADGNACNTETGQCPDSKCSPGWEGAPICDTDVDECADVETSCPSEQPDCVNTPGAYLCLCFEYDNATNTCKGSHQPYNIAETIPVPIMPLVPSLAAGNSTPSRATDNGNNTVRAHDSSLSIRPLPVIATAIRENSSAENNDDTNAFEVAPVDTDLNLVTSSGSSNNIASGLPRSSQIIVSTHSPLTIQPILAKSKSLQKQKPTLQLAALSTASNKTTRMELLDLRGPAVDPVFLLNDQCAQCHQMADCIQNNCTCIPGWTGDGKNCEDFDECQTPGACKLHAECQNLIGSYQCVCDFGFVAHENGCVDIDECAEGLAECRGGNTSMCINTMGGYECQCRSGFIGNPKDPNGCVDVDECQHSLFHCGDKARCVNTQGSFICECFDGYEPTPLSKLVRNDNVPILAISMRPCIDINECAQTPCHANASCTNMNGTFRCDCVDGFVGDGVDCRETILFSIGKNFTVVEDPSVPVALEDPITVFSKSYSSVYVSPLGVISFYQPLPGMIRSAPSDLRTATLLPYHLEFNAQISGAITVTQFSGGANRNEQLMKASLLIQSRFRVHDFQATTLYIFTFDRMREINIKKPNTFQALLIKGIDGSTYAAFLYDKIESAPRGVAGVASTSGFSPVPTNSSPATTSNVGHNGQWIFRIDGAIRQHTIECPSGRVGAPFCKQDCKPGKWGFECANECHCANRHPCDSSNGFCTNSRCAEGFTGFNCSIDADECTMGGHRCHANAICQNTHGSYSCKCNDDFSGDGYFCEAIDRCLVRFQSTCAPNAHCDTTSPDLPECVCDAGFHGDGRRDCAPDDTDGEITSTTTTSRTKITQILSTDMPIQHDDNSVLFVNKKHINTDSIAKSMSPSHVKASATDNNKKTTAENEQKSFTDATSDSESTADSSGMQLILWPIVSCAVWLLLVVIFLTICLYKRRRTRAEKFTPQMMGWSPREYVSTSRSSYVSQFGHT